MSVEITSLTDVAVSKLNDGDDVKQNEEKEDGHTKKNVKEDEQISAPSISTTLGELSAASLGLMNDQVEDPKDKVEVPELPSCASDLVEDPRLLSTRINHNGEHSLLSPAKGEGEDPVSLSSKSYLEDDPLMLPSGSEHHERLPILKGMLGDSQLLSSGIDQFKDFQQLLSESEPVEKSLSTPLNGKGEEPLSLPSASSLSEDSLCRALASDQVKNSQSQPPVTELAEDPLALSPSNNKVEYPLSLSSASDHVEDTQSLSSQSDLEDPNSLPPASDKVTNSTSLLSESDLVEDRLLLPSAVDCSVGKEAPSASICPKDPLSPSNEDPLIILSGDECSEDPLQIQSPMEIDHSIWSKSKMEDTKPCSPAQTKKNKDGVDSDSDSDVIFIERNHEVIELSDDEAGECVDLLTSLNVSDDIINCLKAASKKVSLKLGDLIKNSGSVNNIVVEVPTVTWSLPWVCVSSLFKNPELKSTSKKSPAKSKINKSKRKWTEDSPKKKRSKDNESSVGAKEMNSTLSSIKKEKELYQDTDRILSVIHFDPNKPPEFCEISRSGRLIKKPTRLKDDMTFFRRTRRGRKKQEETIEKVDSAVKTPGDVRYEPSTSDDKYSETSEKSFENSIDSESCDRWMLGLNSDSDNEEIDKDNVSTLPPVSIPSDTIEILSDDGLNRFSMNEKLKKNYKEQKRRETLRHYFCKVLREVKSVNKDFVHNKVPKINILNEAINAIKQLESVINSDKTLHQEMTKRNACLLKELTTLKKTLNNRITK